MDKLTAIKIKYDDGTYSDQIPISVLAENVEWNNAYSLVEVLGSIAFDTKGSVQDQLTQLFNQKVNSTDLTNYVNSTLKSEVTSWLNQNVNPVGSAVVVDSSLTISGAAADAKAVGNELTDLKADLTIQTGSTMLQFEAGYISTKAEVGDVVDTTVISSNSYVHCIDECVEDDVFCLNLVGGGAPRGWAFLDADYKLVSKSVASLSASNLIISAPQNAAYAVFNSQKTDLGLCVKGVLVEQIKNELVTRYFALYNTVTDVINDESLKVGMYVQTLGYHTAGDGMSARYKIVDSGYAYTGYETLTNGLYAIPLLNISNDNNKPTNDLRAMVNTALTYQASGKSFTYAKDASTGETFPTAVDSGYVPNTYYIDCSALSYLILNGITFENSRYGGQNVNIRQNGSYYMNKIGMPKNTSKIRSAYQQALYFAYNGMAYYPNSDYSNIRIGDVVFFSNNDHADRFLSINHVAIYLGRAGSNISGSTRYLVIGNNGDSTDREIKTFFYYYTESDFRKIVLCAGIGEQINHRSGDANIISDGYTEKTKASGSTLMSAWDTIKSIKSFTGYTIYLETDVIPAELRFFVGNTTRSSFFLSESSISTLYPSEEKQKYFLLTEDISNVDNNKKIRIGAKNTDVFTVNSLEVYEGWV